MKTVQDEKYWINRPIKDKDRDWKEHGKDWIEDYILSVDHPHRDLIVEAIRKWHTKPESILDMGCNAGPNLMNFKREFPKAILGGFDVSEAAIKKAKEIIKKGILVVGDLRKMTFLDNTFEVGVADASLMYIPPKDIEKVFNEIDRVVRSTMIIVERVSEKEENNGYIWSRNYPKLLKSIGFKDIELIKLTEKTWPHSKGWAKTGYIIIAHRVSRTGNPN